MKRLDGFLLERFEGLAHGIQKLAGWKCNCYRLAAGFQALCAVFWTGYASHRSDFVGWAIAALYWIGVLVFLKVLPGAEINALCRLLAGVANPKKSFCSLRLMDLVFFASLVVVAFRRSDVFLLLLGSCFVPRDYFDACDPLPPAPSKIREWISTLFTRSVPAKEVA